MDVLAVVLHHAFERGDVRALAVYGTLDRTSRDAVALLSRSHPAVSRQLALHRLACSRTKRVDELTDCDAAYAGDVAALEVLFDGACTRLRHRGSKLYALAAKNGHDAALRWLKDRGCPVRYDDNPARLDGCAAVEHDMIEVVAACNDSPWHDFTKRFGGTDPGPRDWATDDVADVTFSACAQAALRGDVGMLRWARDAGLDWDVWTCAAAAYRGHLDALRWAREHGCPWDAWTCACAARGGHLNVLRWAREHGCPWDAWTFRWAARNAHYAVQTWARDNGCPMSGAHRSTARMLSDQWCADFLWLPGADESCDARTAAGVAAVLDRVDDRPRSRAAGRRARSATP